MSVKVISLWILGFDSILESTEKLIFWSFDSGVYRGRRWSVRVFWIWNYVLAISDWPASAHPIFLFVLLFYYIGVFLNHHRVLDPVAEGVDPPDSKVRSSTLGVYICSIFYFFFLVLFIFHFIYFLFNLNFLSLIFILLKIFPTQTHYFASTILLCFVLFHLSNLSLTYEFLNLGS